MTPISTTDLHLEDEQIDAVLIGDAAAESRAHLRSCPACRARAAELSAPIEHFAAATLLWSERRSATLPPPSVLQAAARTRQWNWAAAMVVLLTAAVTLPPVLRDKPAAETSVAATSTPAASRRASAVDEMAETAVAEEPAKHAAAVTKPVLQAAGTTEAGADKDNAELEQDNRMLAAIDDEWDAATPSPAEAFQLRPASGSSGDAHYAPL